MSRRSIQVLFVLIGIGWMLFVFYDMFIHTFGDCGDDRMCMNYKKVSKGLVFWRGLSITIIIFTAYRIFRKDPDVL